MSSSGGPTAATSEQLELEWTVPPATPATSDLVCWLWAAFPPRGGRLHVSRIAAALGVPVTTMRRWIHAGDASKLSWPQVRRLHQRAILRGRGHYLWPDLDPVSRRRGELLYTAALANGDLIETHPERIPPEWHRNGTLEPHEVHLVHFERAHVYGVTATRHAKALAKVRRFGTVLESRVMPHKYAAVAVKHEMLARVDEHRCVAPRALVPTGRTETWRELGGPTGVVAPLEVAVVHFAGLRRHRQLAQALQEVPNVHVTSVEAADAAAAYVGLTRPADVVVFSSPAYTRSGWHEQETRRTWPGGAWYAGGRGTRGAGTTLTELLDGVREAGGIQARLLVLDSPTPTRGRVRTQLRTLTADTSAHLVLKAPQKVAWPAAVAQLVELATRAERDRDSGAESLLAGLPHYRRG